MPTLPLRTTHTDTDYLRMAKEALAIEATAVAALADKLGSGFTETVQAILACKGRIILIGVGKSGLIARKIAATFASTGTPAFLYMPQKPRTAIWA